MGLDDLNGFTQNSDLLWRIAVQGAKIGSKHGPFPSVITKVTFFLTPYTLSSVTGSGHVKYMVSPFFDFYMTT